MPCPKDELCAEEDNPANVVPGYQLTYRIQDPSQSRFWYVSLVSCVRNADTCAWEAAVDEPFTLEYDLWLVNGNPNEGSGDGNLFNYQYSCDNQVCMHASSRMLSMFSLEH